jgi:D-tyrosyl-tRNA(Tyr) deacylase
MPEENNSKIVIQDLIHKATEKVPRKYLIIASREDRAGMSIVEELKQFGNYDIYITEKSMLHNENLDMEKIKPYDFVIFASKHQSEKKEKTLSVHSPGNWGEAKAGGGVGKVCRSSALFNKELFEMLNHVAREHFFDSKYKVSLECTHHGPLINKPCVFIEIGSTETEWRDRKAAFIIAKAIHNTIKNFYENPYREPAIGIGGPHYCPGFNKIQLGSNVAISHVIPEYALPLTEEMVREAIEKTEEDVEFAVLDWKGLGGAESRKQITDLLDKLYIRWKKISQISKIPEDDLDEEMNKGNEEKMEETIEEKETPKEAGENYQAEIMEMIDETIKEKEDEESVEDKTETNN